MQDRRKAIFYNRKIKKNSKKDFRLRNKKIKPLSQRLVNLRVISNAYAFTKIKVSG